MRGAISIFQTIPILIELIVIALSLVLTINYRKVLMKPQNGVKV